MFEKISMTVLAATLATACVSSQQKTGQTDQYICEERETTGSHVPRPICRPMTKDEVKETHDKESIRRMQQKDQMRQGPGGK